MITNEKNCGKKTHDTVAYMKQMPQHILQGREQIDLDSINILFYLHLVCLLILHTYAQSS